METNYSEYDCVGEMNIKMIIKNKLRSILGKSIEFIQSKGIRPDVEVFLKASLAGSQELTSLNDPIAYINNLRECIEFLNFNISSIKYDNQQKNNIASLRFENLIQKLQYDTPPIPFPIANTFAKYYDQYLGNLSLFEYESYNYSTDVSDHFRISSSAGGKTRLLATVVRFMRPKTCLELGTCYGMSAVIIISMLKAIGDFESFDTIDGWEPMCSLSKETLTNQFGDLVTCNKGMIQKELPKILKSRNHIDFVFHDANHTREDYINDFSMIEPHLSSGAVIILDDIDHNDPRSSVNSQTYEGWKEILKHKRVKRAVEINNSIGLILID